MLAEAWLALRDNWNDPPVPAFRRAAVASPHARYCSPADTGLPGKTLSEKPPATGWLVQHQTPEEFAGSCRQVLRRPHIAVTPNSDRHDSWKAGGQSSVRRFPIPSRCPPAPRPRRATGTLSPGSEHAARPAPHRSSQNVAWAATARSDRIPRLARSSGDRGFACLGAIRAAVLIDPWDSDRPQATITRPDHALHFP